MLFPVCRQVPLSHALSSDRNIKDNNLPLYHPEQLFQCYIISSLLKFPTGTSAWEPLMTYTNKELNEYLMTLSVWWCKRIISPFKNIKASKVAYHVCSGFCSYAVVHSSMFLPTAFCEVIKCATYAIKIIQWSWDCGKL